MAGIGAAVLAGTALFMFKLYREIIVIREEEKPDTMCVDQKGDVDVKEQEQQEQYQYQDQYQDHDQDHTEPANEALSSIPVDKLSHFKPLLAGHVDSAQLQTAQGHHHDVLLQYTHHHPSTPPPPPLTTITSKMIAKPIGKAVFDDDSVAFVYRGDSSTVVLGGGCDRIDRLSVLAVVLSGCLQALQSLRQDGLHYADTQELLQSVAVTPAGKAKLLGAHAIKQAKQTVSEEEVVGQVALVAEMVVAGRPERWAVEREQAAKLCRDLREMKTVAAAEKRLASVSKHR